MKKVLFIMFALMTTTWASAQVERLRVGEPTGSGMDQLALKRLVDTFSNLADVKDVKSQMDLFTDDAEVHSKAGEHVSVMKGKEPLCLKAIDHCRKRAAPPNRGCCSFSRWCYTDNYFTAGSHLQRTGETIAPSFFNSAKALSTSLRSAPRAFVTSPAETGLPASRMACNTCSFMLLAIFRM